ncbi:MAG: D-alanyl-D-alanine carboxypeptidase family protein [Bacteroidota bacterium]
MRRTPLKPNILFALLVASFFTACTSNSKQAPIAEQQTQTENMPSWITTSYVMGHFDPADHPDFAAIPTSLADREGLFLRKEVLDAFIQMHDTALDAGHKMFIRSATRNFDYQKGIWTRKWSGETGLSDGTRASAIADPVERSKKILRYSSMPGTSRHHWGTDLDINSFDNDYFETGPGAELYQWMKANAKEFGFCQPYTAKTDGRTGYEEERWHWSYTPTSESITAYCKRHLSDDLITGFDGSKTAGQIKVVENYVLGINSVCL